MKKTRHRGIMQIARNRYRIRVYFTDSRTGKQKEAERTVRGTLTEAKRLREELRCELESDTDKARVKLGEFVRSWLAARLPRLKPSTAEKYVGDLERHILPALGHYYVDQLRPSDIAAFVAAQSRTFAGWTVANRLRLLRTIAKDAVAEGLTDIDFCARVRLPRCNAWDEDNPNRLTAKQLDKLLAVMRDKESYWYALVLTMSLTGLRWGEVSGLSWDDIDEPAGVIRIRRANWKGKPVEPKTAKSKRTVPLGPELAAALREHRARMVATQHPGLPAGWVFPTRGGSLHKGTPLRAVLTRVLEAAEIDAHLTPHGLRRTFNDLARRVADTIVVQSITGHVTDAMTAHYSVVDSGEKQRVQADVLQLLRQTGTETGTPRRVAAGRSKEARTSQRCRPDSNW